MARIARLEVAHVFDSPLRREFVHPEPVLQDGVMALPDAPGLGITLNDEAVERWRVDRT